MITNYTRVPSARMYSVAMRALIPLLLVSVVEALEFPYGWELWTTQDDYDVLKFPQGSGSDKGFANFSFSGRVKSTGRDYTIYIGTLSKGLPETLGFELPAGGCCHRSKTSAISQMYNCTYATNAGFFDTTNGCCVGNLISNGKTVQLAGSSRVNFALEKDQFMIGYLTNSTLKSGVFSQFISGAGWLVRKGASYVNQSMITENLQQKFVTEKAPRTAIVLSSNGSLSLMQVDGVEVLNEGLDLYEFAEVLIDYGAWQAANLDGGGSSTSVYKGTVVDKPSCVDTKIVCERPVTSIACIRNV